MNQQVSGRKKYRVRFKSSDCLNCEKRTNCTRVQKVASSFVFWKRRTGILGRFADGGKKNNEWQKLYQERAETEETISQSEAMD